MEYVVVHKPSKPGFVADCVCIDGTLSLQHAQHDAHSHSHRRNGRIARILPYLFDRAPRNVCVGSVLAGFDVISCITHPACTPEDLTTIT